MSYTEAVKECWDEHDENGADNELTCHVKSHQI
jgi:hypothetical protein